MKVEDKVKAGIVCLLILGLHSLTLGDVIYVGSNPIGDPNADGTVTRIDASGNQTVISGGIDATEGDGQAGDIQTLTVLPNGDAWYGTDYPVGDSAIGGSFFMYDHRADENTLWTGGFLQYYDMKALTMEEVLVTSALFNGCFTTVPPVDLGSFAHTIYGFGTPMGEIEGSKVGGVTSAHYTGDALYITPFSGGSVYHHDAETNAYTQVGSGLGSIENIKLAALPNGSTLVGDGLGYIIECTEDTSISMLSSDYMDEIFYEIEGLADGNALVASSIDSNSIDYLDVETGTATNIDSGYGVVEVMLALPNGDAVFGSSINGGSLYEFDAETQSISLAASNLGTFNDIELLSAGSVVFGTSASGGTVYKYDVVGDNLTNYGSNWGSPDEIAAFVPSIGGRAWGESPYNREVDVEPATVLSWEPRSDWETGEADPNIASHKVYFAEGPNEPNLGASDLVATIPAGDPMEYVPSGNLSYNMTYYWRVDEVMDDSSVITGDVWQFTVAGAEPVIETFNNVVTAMQLSPVSLSATVTDVDNDVSSVSWKLTSLPAGSGLDPNTAVTDTTSDVYAPTAEFTPDVTGTYTVELTVKDSTSNTTIATADVDVYADTCTAAQEDPTGYVGNYYDTNGDCKVDFADFAAFAEEWLDDTSITEQIEY